MKLYKLANNLIVLGKPDKMMSDRDGIRGCVVGYTNGLEKKLDLMGRSLTTHNPIGYYCGFVTDYELYDFNVILKSENKLFINEERGEILIQTVDERRSAYDENRGKTYTLITKDSINKRTLIRTKNPYNPNHIEKGKIWIEMIGESRSLTNYPYGSRSSWEFIEYKSIKEIRLTNE